MTKTTFMDRVRAAYSLSVAVNEGKRPDNASLNALGLKDPFERRFKR